MYSLKLKGIKNHTYSKKISEKSINAFDENIINFLNTLSQSILKDSKSYAYPDLISYAYWIRINQLRIFKKNFNDKIFYKGRGLVTHFAPNNVPTVFAYSLALGLICGNTNIIKISKESIYQTNSIIKKINKILKLKKFIKIREMIQIISYENKNTEITKDIIKKADARIFWGSDNSIDFLKKFKTKTRSIDIIFSSRYSFTVIDINKYSKLSYKSKILLAEKFFNDTMVFDQNACSSSKIVFWIGKNNRNQNLFWELLANIIKKKYIISDYVAFNKLTKFQIDQIELGKNAEYKNFINYLNVVNLKKIENNIENYSFNSGYFYEYNIRKLKNLANHLNDKTQTMTYFGINKKELLSLLNTSELNLNRIAPIGQANNFSIFWDGYDILKILTKPIIYL